MTQCFICGKLFYLTQKVWMCYKATIGRNKNGVNPKEEKLIICNECFKKIK